MLVVLEGLDGAGKSTQVAMLRKYLEERCGKVEYIHFPRYDAPVYGDLIGKFLRGGFGSLGEVHPQLVALLYAEDRHEASADMKKTLSEGGSILLDRYVYSNIAYQCAKVEDEAGREALREWILQTEFGQFALPRPDLNLFLDVPIGFVATKLSAQRQGSDREYLEGRKDIHEADIGFQQKVRHIYLKQASSDPHFLRVDCTGDKGGMLPPEVIFSKVKEIVNLYLK